MPALILLVALVLRFYQIDSIPPGLQHDEAQYGLDALDVIGGNRDLWFERANGREPFWIYLLALGYSVFGVGLTTQHVLAAIIGTLTVALTYPALRSLFDRNIALLTTALLGISYWHVHLSRIGFRVITMPLLAVMALWLFWRALQRERWLDYAVAGVALGACLYTYFSARAIPLVFVGFVVYLFFTKRAYVFQRWPRLLAYGGIAALVFTPLGLALISHGALLGQRAEQTLNLRPLLARGDPVPLFSDMIRTLGMFSIQGDVVWRYNLSGRPVFDPVLSAFFYGGLVLAIRRWRDPAHAFAVIWLAVMLLPALVTGESPHFLRTLGIVPVVFVFPALAMRWLGRRLQAQWSPRLTAGAGIALLALVGAQTARDYFLVWANADEVRVQFRADLTHLADYLRVHTIEGRAFVSAEYPDDIDQFVLRILLGGRSPDAVWFNGQRAIPIPSKGPVTYFFPGFAAPPAGIFERYLPDAREVDRVAEPTGRVSLVVYRLDAPPPLLCHHPCPLPEGEGREKGLPLPLGEGGGEGTGQDRAGTGPAGSPTVPGLRLLGSWIPQSLVAGQGATAVALWQVEDARQTAPDQSFFMHLLGPWDSVWAQRDFSAYPPYQWQSGDRILNLHALETDPATAPGVYRVVLGSYRRSTLERSQFAVGALIETSTTVAEVKIGPPAESSSPLPEGEIPVGANYRDAVRLVSYQIDKAVAAPSERLGVALRWEALRSALPDYTVFVHLYDSSGALRAQRDSQPVFGAYPTPLWSSGQVVLDRYDVPLPADLPPGKYRLAVGLYSRDSGARLTVAGVPAVWRARLEDLLDVTPWGLNYRLESDRVLLRAVTIR